MQPCAFHVSSYELSIHNRSEWGPSVMVPLHWPRVHVCFEIMRSSFTLAFTGNIVATRPTMISSSPCKLKLSTIETVLLWAWRLLRLLRIHLSVLLLFFFSYHHTSSLLYQQSSPQQWKHCSSGSQSSPSWAGLLPSSWSPTLLRRLLRQFLRVVLLVAFAGLWLILDLVIRCLHPRLRPSSCLPWPHHSPPVTRW
jgi:hypothetical protein